LKKIQIYALEKVYLLLILIDFKNAEGRTFPIDDLLGSLNNLEL